MSAIREDSAADPWAIVADLRRERDEALAREAAMAEILQIINRSPGDLAPVFDAMLEKATNLCEASFGILWNFTGEFAVAGALHQVPAAYAELCSTSFRPSPGSGPAHPAGLQLSPQRADVNLHEVGVVCVIAPHLGQQLVLGQGLPTVTHKKREQSKLGRGQRELPTAPGGEGVFFIDEQRPDLQHLRDRASPGHCCPF